MQQLEIANYIKFHLAISRKIRTFIETHKTHLKILNKINMANGNKCGIDQ